MRGISQFAGQFYCRKQVKKTEGPRSESLGFWSGHRLSATCRIVLFASFLFAAGLVSADTNYFIKATGFWNDNSKWNANTGTETINLAPVNDPVAKVNSMKSATITLSTSAIVGYLALNSGDSTTDVIIDGGVLRSEKDGNGSWNAIGYNKTASILIKNGGSWVCDGRIDVGLNDGVNGQVNTFTMSADSGNVTVSNNFSLGRSFDGSHSVTATANILGGTLYVGGSLYIASDGVNTLNISDDAMVIIDGDESTIVQGYIQSEKITANGGSGTPIVDYNASTPGKTTIRAMAGTLSPNWHVVDAQYSTNELIITPFSALADFGIVGDGAADVTDEIQSALIVIANLGGGSLFLPEGFYKIGGNLTIPAGVTLRGDWKKPEPGQPVVGTVLMAYAGRDDENGQYFITLSGSGGVNGISIWYPEQLPTDIRPYPITIGNSGAATVENVTFVNSYFGYSSYREGTTGRPFVRNVYGTPLRTGIEFDCIADIGRLETITFSPDFWAGSGLPGAPVSGEHEAWIYNNGTGVILRRLDWSYSCYITVEGYNIGLAMRPSRWDGKAPNGQCYDYHLIDCKTGIYIEKNLYNGEQFTRFTIQGAETGIYMGPDTQETSMFHTCDIEASGAAFYCEGSTSRAMIMSCDFKDGQVQFDGGYLSVINSDFSNDDAHIVLGRNMLGASILGNRFAGPAEILDNTGYPVVIDHTPLDVAPLPPYDYRKPETAYLPNTTNLYVVTDAPFSAAADGGTDDTAAFRSALVMADANGGGTVFVPGGNYRLDGTLTVPAGVELRGIFDIPHGTDIKGSLLNIYSGHNDANGTPFIQLEADAGIKGLNFHYPNQIFDAGDTDMYGFVPYPFMVRGLGADVYVVNISATIPYQLLDLATARCDRHYVDYIFSTCLKTGIHVGGGSEKGELHNIQFNPNSYTFRSNEYDSIPSGTSSSVHDLQWRYAMPYLFGHMTDQVVHECFVFAGVRGIHLFEENGQGPSGYCLGFGADACTTAFLVDDIGNGGFEPINTQIVSTNPDAGHYFETGAGLTDEFRMFSGSAWGSHQYSAVLRGGDVELQNLLIQRDGTSGTYLIENNVTLQTYASSLDNKQNNTFLTIDTTAAVLFAGNVLNLDAAQMPDDSAPNVTAIGNLRYGASASGSDIEWTNGSGDRSWNTAANWNSGVPAASDAVTIAASSGPISTGTSSAQTLIVGESASGTLDVTGGRLSVSDWMVLGFSPDNSGSLILDGGDVNVANDLYVGLSGSGSVELSAGMLTVGSLSIDGNGIVQVGNGMLVVDGNVTNQLNTYITDGRLVASGGVLPLEVDYNAVNPGKSTVSVGVPPVTTTIWNPDTGSAYWTSGNSWTKGVAPVNQQQNLKVVFNVEGAKECLLSTNSTVAQLVLGDNGTTNGTFLRLVDGADLLTGLKAGGEINWTGIGYNRNGRLTVESGAVMTAANHLWIGNFSPAVGILDIEGGTVQVNGQLGLGWNTGTGYINLKSGLLNLNQMDAAQSINGSSKINIENGVIVINGNHLNSINNYAAAGKITAYDGSGTVQVDYNVSNAGKTTVTAAAPLSGYHAWSQDWGVDIGSDTNDYDSDLRNNFYEYAFNGDPTNALVTGEDPVLLNADDSVLLIHLRRIDDTNMVYYLETSTNLVSNTWTNAGYTVTGTNVMRGGAFYDEVTNTVSTAQEQTFIRLNVTYP